MDIEACGVCLTDLHVVDGELPDPTLPLVPGHQIPRGNHRALGPGVTGFEIGDRVGVPWLGVDVWSLQLLHEWTREPLPDRG